MKQEIIIIGAGASGLAAGIFCSQRGSFCYNYGTYSKTGEKASFNR